MRKLEDVIAEHMKNPEFKKEWDALETEFCSAESREQDEIQNREQTGLAS